MSPALRPRGPMVNEESEAFWNATAEGELLLRRCDDCESYHWYPRTKCPFCHSPATRWVRSVGTGEIYSFSVVRRTERPYALVYVTLDEGVTIMSNLITEDLDSLRIGQRVKIDLQHRGEDWALPAFVPDR